MSICAIVKWKRTAENGDLCSFVLRCLNQPCIYNGIGILHSLQFLYRYCWFEVLNWHFTQNLSASGGFASDQGIDPGPYWRSVPTSQTSVRHATHAYSHNIQYLIFPYNTCMTCDNVVILLLRGSCPKSAVTSPQQCTQSLSCSRFHPNWFTFGRVITGVIAEGVNTAKLSRRVNPVFGFQPNNKW